MKSIYRKFQLYYITSLLIISFQSVASTYNYKADVKGMVCAFCVYSVENQVRKLPGVDADSVNVSLRNNSVKFNSQKQISTQTLSKIFSKSAFTLSNLTVTQSSNVKSTVSKKARLEISIDVFEIDQFTSLLKTIGDIAVQKPSRIVVVAPQDQEETILKAILMGRKKAIKVYFNVNDEADKVDIKLFDNSKI